MISIIIPFYNAKETLPYCLNSIMSQSYKNYELILIDDGSDDDSIHICNSYKTKIKNFTLLKSEKRGQGSARNLGIEVAKGKYITFIDSDDVIHPQFLEILYDSITKNKADIAVCDFIRASHYNIDNKEIYSSYDVHTLDNAVLIKKLYNEHPFMTLWAKLYSKDLITSKMLSNGIGEDVEFNSKIYSKSPKIIIVDLPLYFWIVRNGSLSHSSFNINDIIRIKNFFCSWLNLRKNKIHSRYALKKFYKALLSLRYDAPDEYKSTVERTVKYYRKKTIKYLYRDVPIFYVMCINFLLFSPSIYRLLRKCSETLFVIKRKLI